jgi:hypothetical protein
MGGFGSGRSGGRPVIEDGLVLDIDKLRRDNLIRSNSSRSGSLTWSEVHSRREVATIGYSTSIGDDEGSLRLRYTTTTRYSGEKIDSDYEIMLETVPQPFGGIRWFFTCPATGARASRLYMPPGSTRFLSRGAYRHLAYQSQREAPYDRALRRAFKYRRKLGNHDGIDGWIAKPKWMRQATFERRIEQVERAEAIVNAHLAGFLDRLRRRDPGLRI